MERWAGGWVFVPRSRGAPAATAPPPTPGQAPAPAGPAAAAPPPADFTLLDIRSTVLPLKLTWARDAVYPAAICLRKEFRLMKVVKFTAKADLSLPDRRVVWGASCRDTVFHGRLSVNAQARVLEYRKKFQLPNGSGLTIGAGLQHIGEGGLDLSQPLRQQFRPLFSASLHLGALGSGSIVQTGDGFDVKQRLPVPLGWAGVQYPRVELQTFATLRIPQLTMRYSVQRSGRPPASLGDSGSDPLHLHIREANLVFWL